MAHRYRLYPEEDRVPVLVRHCADSRFVWNLALEQLNLWRSGRASSPGSPERFRQLAEARQAEPWLAEGSSAVQQQALRDFDQALKNWWAGTHGRPRWRKVGRNDSFCVRDVNVRVLNRKWAEILVPKAGWVRFRLSRPLPAGYGMARVKRDRAGRWFVSFAAPQPEFVRESKGGAVGVDRGVVNTAAFSEPVAGADLVHIPGLTPKERERMLRLERKLARQKKGSRRREKTRRALARLVVREADRAKDWIEQTTTGLVRAFDVIVFEDLRVRQMMRSARGTLAVPGRNVKAKQGLNRGIARARWAAFALRAEQKAAAGTAAASVVFVDPAGTSQTCSCGHRAAENRKSQAVFCCDACGYRQHADIQAARTIRERGIEKLLACAAGGAVPARGDLQPPGGSGNREAKSGQRTTEAA